MRVVGRIDDIQPKTFPPKIVEREVQVLADDLLLAQPFLAGFFAAGFFAAGFFVGGWASTFTCGALRPGSSLSGFAGFGLSSKRVTISRSRQSRSRMSRVASLPQAKVEAQPPTKKRNEEACGEKGGEEGLSQQEIVCEDLNPALDDLRRIGFRLDVIYPADDPHTAILSSRDSTSG